MLFGLRDAPATFQSVLDKVLSGVQWRTCLIHLDCFIVFLKTIKEHYTRLNTILMLFRNAENSLKQKNCFFFQSLVDSFGHFVDPIRPSVAQTAAEAFRVSYVPHTLNLVRFFLGVCNNYQRFVKDFSKIARPLTVVTRKGASPDFTNLTTFRRKASDSLKQRLASPPVLLSPKPGHAYTMDCDASAY